MNNGQPIKLDLKNLTDIDKNNMAEEFSEGSTILKNLLLKMWKCGIETYACCGGHDKMIKGVKTYSNPYLFFDVLNFKGEELRNLLIRVLQFNKKGVFDCSFQVDYMHENQNQRNGLSFFSIYGKSSPKEFFSLVEKIIFNTNKNEGLNLTKQDYEIIDCLIQMYSIDMEKYLKISKKTPSHQFSCIEIQSTDNEFYILTRDNCKYKIYKQIDEKGNIIGYKVAEGYYTKVKSGEYITLKNGKFFKLNEEGIKNYKQFRSYKNYNLLKRFNLEDFNNVTNKLN